MSVVGGSNRRRRQDRNFAPGELSPIFSHLPDDCAVLPSLVQPPHCALLASICEGKGGEGGPKEEEDREAEDKGEAVTISTLKVSVAVSETVEKSIVIAEWS